MASDVADLPVRHVLRVAARRACPRRRALRLFSQRTKYPVDSSAAVLTMAMSLIIIWLSLAYVRQSWNIGEGSANPGGIPARYILMKALIPIGFALLFLQSLAQTIQLLSRLAEAR